eukprot:jgi/Tetstr1/454680/TSEL_041569.t1
MLPFDLQSGFCAMGIRPSDSHYFTSLAWRAQYLFLASPAARFYPRELQNVLGSKWGGRAAGGAGVLGAADERRHITWKELKAVRLAVDESFLPHLAGRRVLLPDDNQAVCNVLPGLTSRSLEMMAELRKLWYLLDRNGVQIRARYIRGRPQTSDLRSRRADRLSRHLDGDDEQLDPVLFAELGALWGAHSVDRFASAPNAMLPRYNVAWLDAGCEAVDSLHLADAE